MGKERTEFYRSQTIPGNGSAEQQVRMLFPNELAARRKRPIHENHWLVVMTDGDGFTPNDRRSLLYQEVQNRSMDKPKSDERYVIFIPCRNLESWFEWIETEKIDEETDYKNKYRNAKPTKFGNRLFQKCQNTDKQNYPESIKDACQQWEKMVGMT